MSFPYAGFGSMMRHDSGTHLTDRETLTTYQFIGAWQAGILLRYPRTIPEVIHTRFDPMNIRKKPQVGASSGSWGVEPRIELRDLLLPQERLHVRMGPADAVEARRKEVREEDVATGA